MQVELIAVDNLTPYARNARTHSPDQIAQIAASIAEFGFTNPILIGEDSVIIAGHGRLMAAQRQTATPEFASTHPSDQTRIAELQRYIASKGW